MQDHRKFVLRQPCLVCGRMPSDPHHLTFTQPRALGRRVSDEFTVPVCRVHRKRPANPAYRVIVTREKMLPLTGKLMGTHVDGYGSAWS